MAMIGMRHVVAAALNTHTDGSEPTYSAGFDVGGAISGNLTKNRNNNDLYYDDVLGESDNGLTSMSLELGLDDLLEDVQEKLGMLKKTTAGSPSVTTYYETTKESTLVGLGYIRVREKNNTIAYQAIWIYKIQFSADSENSQTKGESIEWQTPTINGKAFSVDVDGSGDLAFRKIQVFSSESAAKTYLDTIAGITRT